MRVKGKKKREPGVNITVSRQAHLAMAKKALKAKPRMTLREIINEFNGLPKEL